MTKNQFSGITYKICHIITDLDVGGAEYMLKRLVEEQHADRDSLVIISLTGIGKIGEQLQAQGFHVYALNMKGKLAFPVALWRLSKLLKKLKPDLVQTWMYHADLLGGLAAYFSGIRKIVWGIHCSKLPIGRPLTKLVMLSCARLSSWLPAKIVCVAEAAKINHIQYGYSGQKMTIIPNGFSAAPLIKSRSQNRPILTTHGAAAAAFIVGCVGRFHPDKGQDILVLAIQLIAQQAPHVQFVFAGRGCDEQNSELTKLITSCGVRDKIILLGERDDIQSLLPEFDLFCMPSRSEAFPVALGEAMLAGLPCVATNVGDVKELGGATTVFVEPCDVDALANAIIEMVQQTPEQRAEKGLLGRSHVEKSYSIQHVSDLYKNIYQDLLSY
jgi:glycosyltransferase involved in cell wall biosynthesis